jgi:hypothetical protein
MLLTAASAALPRDALERAVTEEARRVSAVLSSKGAQAAAEALSSSL